MAIAKEVMARTAASKAEQTMGEEEACDQMIGSSSMAARCGLSLEERASLKRS